MRDGNFQTTFTFAVDTANTSGGTFDGIPCFAVTAKLGARRVADSIKKWTDFAVTAKMEVLNAADSR